MLILQSAVKFGNDTTCSLNLKLPLRFTQY